MSLLSRPLFERLLSAVNRTKDSPYNSLLTSPARRWERNLPLKASLAAGGSLFLAYLLSFFPSYLPFHYLFLGCTFFLTGVPALIHALETIAKMRIGINVLMTLAAFGSLFIGEGLEGGLLLVLFAFSEALEEMIKGKAKETIRSLKHLAPEKAYVIQPDGSTLLTALNRVPLGSTLLIKPGELVPLDGEVMEGTALASFAHLTGEKKPVSLQPGSTVPSGSKIQEGELRLRVTKLHNKSTLSRIVSLVSQAQQSKPKLQSWLEKWKPRYALTIILLSLITAISFPFIFSMTFLGDEGSIVRALTFLVAASPCALIIGPPIVYLSALSRAASRGILLKGSSPLEALAACSTIVFDKTGTLTTGEFICHPLEPICEQQKASLKQAYAVAYTLENGNHHPLSKAIIERSKAEGAQGICLENFRKVPGFGIKAFYPDLSCEVFLGNYRFIEDHLSKASREDLQKKAQKAKERGYVLSFLLIGESLFLFSFEDSIRKNAKAVLQSMQQRHSVRPVLLTGDHQENAKQVAEQVGIQEFYSELTPEDKLTKVKEYGKHSPVAMVGDGLNDAPALAWSHVGIAMGKIGTLTAIEASDIILLKDSLSHLGELFTLSYKAKKTLTQNVAFAFAIIIFAGLLGLLGWIPLWLAVLLHEGGTVLVGLNGLRLLRS